MKYLISLVKVMSGSSGLNIEAAARKYLLEISSFKSDFAYLDTIDEYVLGRYENFPNDFIVFTDKGMRIVEGDAETYVSFDQLLYVSLPVMEDANWNVLLRCNKKVRKIALVLTTGEVFYIPVLNETSVMTFHPEAEPAEFQVLDIFPVLRFLNKVAFFQNKRRRKTDRIAVGFAALAALFALLYLIQISKANSEAYVLLMLGSLIAWLYLALRDYFRRH